MPELLEEHRRQCPNPESGPIFASTLRDGQWTRISLDNLRTRQMLPALNRCKHCGLADGKKQVKQAKDGHKFERDPRLVAWRGWHSARSGVATNLDDFGITPNVISRTLRHSNPSVTLNHYIKPKLDAVTAGMGKFGEKIAVRNLLDSDRTVISESGQQRQTVN